MDLQVEYFRNIDLEDSFFDDLKVNYPGFDKWFQKKADSGETALIFKDENDNLRDFLYLKIEDEDLTDVTPVLPKKRRLKVGTFKVINEGRHTRRGERFMKKIMDRAINDNVEEIYVTIFPQENLLHLIRFFEKYGFENRAKKFHGDRYEVVLVKDMRKSTSDIFLDYPRINIKETDKYLLSIYPPFHTQMFPDSKLKGESFDIIQDVSETNSIYKTYICWMRDTRILKRGDILLIYRTTDNMGPAAYRSVATSICTVDEIKTYRDFKNYDEFIDYMKSYSIFDKPDLIKWYKYKSNFIVIRMLYNIALPKRIIRKELIEQVGISRDAYWGFCSISNEKFNKILELGEVNPNYFIEF